MVRTAMQNWFRKNLIQTSSRPKKKPDFRSQVTTVALSIWTKPSLQFNAQLRFLEKKDSFSALIL